MEAQILEGPRGQKAREKWPISPTPTLAELGDDAACRSDPTFTRASPGLAVAEQLPQIIIIITYHSLPAKGRLPNGKIQQQQQEQ